jgi:hypothetical protein
MVGSKTTGKGRRAMKDKEPPPPSRVKRRLIQAAVEIEESDADRIVFMHTTMCQTSMPYRDPGPMRLWQRRQGAVRLEIQAGRLFDAKRDDYVDVGLPFGPKPRLILAHLNAEALRTRSPVIEVDNSLTAFVDRIGLTRDGRSIRIVRTQLGRLSAANIRLAFKMGDGQARQVNAHIVGGLDLWAPSDPRQRALWPSSVTLDSQYFESLQRHGVPLDERSVAALSHTAMGLDTYMWLAQRLHRVDPFQPQIITWPALRAQFGWHYERVRDFKRVFRHTLDMVLTQYRGAKVELDDRGMTLRSSPPPVVGRIWPVRRR